MSLVSLIKKYRGFFIPYLLFLLLGGVFLLLNTRIESHIILNQYLSPLFDNFFTYYTYFGDGLMLFAIALLLLFVNFRYAFFLGTTGAISGIITNLLKNFAFDDSDRPFYVFRYFYREYSLQLVLPEDAMNIHNSFPSGHTTGAFSLFVGLMFIYGKPKWAGVFFILAILAGYSRVYLSQHFFTDIYAGSLIGTCVGIMGWVVFENIRKRNGILWLEKSLINLK